MYKVDENEYLSEFQFLIGSLVTFDFLEEGDYLIEFQFLIGSLVTMKAWILAKS